MWFNPKCMRKFFKYLIIIFLLGAGGWLGTRTYQRYQAKKESEQRVQTLQHVGFESLAGGKVYLNEFDRQKPTVIVYFNPECEHCQYEATEIGRHASEFGKANTLLITPERSAEKLKTFAQAYHLNEVDNLAILIDRDKQFVKYFGTAVFPSVFIYAPGGKLLKSYKGEVKIEAIMESL